MYIFPVERGYQYLYVSICAVINPCKDMGWILSVLAVSFVYIHTLLEKDIEIYVFTI